MLLALLRTACKIDRVTRLCYTQAYALFGAGRIAIFLEVLCACAQIEKSEPN